MSKLLRIIVLSVLLSLVTLSCDKPPETEAVTCIVKEVVIVDINNQNIIMEHKTTFKTTLYTTPSDADIPIEANIGDSVYISICSDDTVTITGKVFVPVPVTTTEIITEAPTDATTTE